MKRLYFLTLLAGISAIAFGQFPATNKYISFSSTTDEGVSIANGSSFGLTNTQSFTIEYWMRTTNANASGGCIFAEQYCPGASTGVLTGVSNGKIFLGLDAATATYSTVNSNCSVNDGKWHHIACVSNIVTDSLYIYIDGIENGRVENTTTGSYISGSASAFVGRRAACATTNNYYGDVDELRIWQKAKTPAEINAEKDMELAGNEASLILYYKFSNNTNGTGQSVTNSCTNNSLYAGTTMGNASEPVFNTAQQTSNPVVCGPSVGPVLWLKADAGTNTAPGTPATNGQTVTTWVDQSGYMNDAVQNTAAYKPTLITNALNGKPVLRFNNNLLVTPSIDLSSIDKVDMYVVYKSSNLNGTWEVIVENGPNFNTTPGFLFADNTQPAYAYKGMYVGNSSGNNANYNIKDYPFKANTFKVVNSSFDRAATAANEVNLRINGVNCTLNEQYYGTDYTGNYFNQPFYIGNRGSSIGADPLIGDVAEIIVYNRNLSLSEKQAVESYLNTKYNIQCAVDNPQPGSGNCLQMGSTGAFAQDAADIDFGSNDFTIEFWTMKRANTSAGNNAACVTKWNNGGVAGSNEFAVSTTTDGNNNIPAFFLGTASTYYQANATTSLALNKWYHIAAVREGANIKIYVNGILEGTTAIPSGTTIPNVAALTYLALGYYSSGFPNASNLDEVRIWNTALSQTTIRDWMCKKETSLHPNHAGLLRYYRFDEPSGLNIWGNQINSCVTEAYSNGAVTAVSGAPIGDVSAYDYTANTATANVNFGSPADNITATMNAGASAGVHVYGVNELPNNQAYPDVAGNNKYAGVFVVNGNVSAAYDVAYNYTNNTAVTSAIEPQLKLFKRSDNSSTSWAQASNQTLNTTANTISATGQNTEYVLGAVQTPVAPSCYASFPNAGDLFNRTDNASSVSLLDLTVDNFTYEIWANPTQALGAGSTSGDRYLIWPEQVTQYGKSGYGIGIAVGTNGIRVYSHAAGILSVFMSYSVTINSWTHIALTINSAHEGILYVNGLPVATASGLSTARATDGFMYSDYYGHYFGQAADFRLFNSVRTGSQIMSDMNSALPVNEPGLLVMYDFSNRYNGAGQLIKNICTNQSSTLLLDKITIGSNTTPIFNCTGQDFPVMVPPSCAAKFDGAGSYVNITNTPTTMPTKGTIEFWMNQPSFSDWQIPLATFSPTVTSGTFTDGMYFQTYANGNLYFIYASSYSVYGIELLGTLTTNRNYHIALSWDLTTQRIKGYVDGRVVFEKPLTTTFPTSIPKLSLGGGFANGRYYNGTLDEVRYWNVERTQSEIISNTQGITGNETGLVAYYNFNDNTIGGNGQTITNQCAATGTALNGTTVSTSTYPKFPCSFNTPTCGIKFNGSTDRVTVPYNAALSLTQFTVAGWVKTSSAAVYQTVACKQYDVNNQNYSLYVHNGKAEITFQRSPIVTGGGQVAIGTSNVNDGQWHYLAGTFDGANLKIYVDGALENTVASTYTPLTSGYPFAIGAWPAGDNPLTGSVDEISVWNTAKTAGDIYAMMNASLTGTEANLVAYYNFNGNNRSGQGRTVANLCTATGSTLNGTTVGTALTPVFDCAPPPFINPECNVVLNGTNDYLTVPHNTLLNRSTFTVGAYIKTTTAGSSKAIIHKIASGTDLNYGLGIDAANHGLVSFTDNTTGNAVQCAGTTTLTDGTWHYVVGTYDGAALKLYVDGVLDNSVATTATPRTGTGILSLGSSNGAIKFTGSLDELSIWSNALSLSQIQGMIGQRLVGNESGLVAYYNFANNNNDGQGETVYNSCSATGSTLNGTSVGTSTTPKFTCSELLINDPACALLLNGNLDGASATNGGAAPYPSLTQNFTMEVVAKPLMKKRPSSPGQFPVWPPGHYIENGIVGQTYLIYPDNGSTYGAGHAGVGISIGTNGIGVYEHSNNYLPGRLNYYGNVPDWAHISVVSENGLLKLYVNGSLKGSVVASGYTLHPSLGLSGNGYGNYGGYISEVRVWNTALTTDQIRNNINANLSGSEANLVNLYKFNSNTANGLGQTISGSGSMASSITYRTVGSQYTPLFTCANTASVRRDTLPGSGKMLSFDGNGSFAELGNWGNTPAQGTISLWYNASSVKENAVLFTTTHFRNQRGNHKGFGVMIKNSKLILTIGTDTTVAGYQDEAVLLNSITTNQWYHLSFSWNTGTGAYNAYINGLPVASGTSTFMPAKFESVKAGSGIVDGNINGWHGLIDEVTEWNKILSQTEVQQQMCSKINSAQANFSNVLHNYRFDNTNGGNNFISDYVGTAHGIYCYPYTYDYWIFSNGGTFYHEQYPMHSFGDLGTASSPIGSYSSYQYNGNTSATSLNVGNGGAAANADVVTATLTTGTADGIHVYGEDVWPNTVYGVNDTVPESHRYAGVFVVNPNAAQYTLKYDYTNNPYITPTIEPQLKLFKRNHNAITVWAQSNNVTLDMANNYLQATGQNTEYILAKNTNALPLQLLSFTAQRQSNNALLSWHTAQMQNVKGFEVERSSDGVSFTAIGFVTATTANAYTFNDLLNGNGKYFYRLRMVDNDGKFSYSDVRLIIVSEKAEIAIYPNPATDRLQVTSSMPMQSCRIVDMQGKEVLRVNTSSSQTELQVGKLASGIYLLELVINNERSSYKIIKQ